MSEEVTDQAFRTKLDISQVLLRQLDRTNQSISNIEEGSYESYVRQLMRQLPMKYVDWVLSEQQTKRYNQTVTKFESQEFCGIRAGTPENPLMKRDFYGEPHKPRTIEGKIDWTDPNILSPKLFTTVETDYEALNDVIMEALENAGLTWKTEPLNSEYGLYPEKEDIDEATPTPIDDPKKNDPQEQNPYYHICWINYKETIKRVTNFRGYACGIDQGEKPWFFTEIAHRQKKQKPIVLMITATQGEGKTYCAIRLGEIFDKRFDPDKQIVMDRSNIMKLVSGRGHLKRNQVIIIDESQWGASAREWGTREQIKLMKFLAAARFKGYVIIIVSLHRSMLDSIIRERIINFHIHMEERGRATVYETRHARFDENKYPARRGGLLVQLPDYDACDATTCLDCDYDKTCMTIRARYERNKTEFIESEAEKDEVQETKAAAAEMSEKELAEMLTPYIHEIPLTLKGYYEIDDVKYTLIDRLGLDISHRKATRVRAHLMRLKTPEK